jgi:hypothetical protein
LSNYGNLSTGRHFRQRIGIGRRLIDYWSWHLSDYRCRSSARRLGYRQRLCCDVGPSRGALGIPAWRGRRIEEIRGLTKRRKIPISSSSRTAGPINVSLSVFFANAMASVTVNPSPNAPVSKALDAQAQRLPSWSLRLSLQPSPAACWMRITTDSLRTSMLG